MFDAALINKVKRETLFGLVAFGSFRY